MTDVAFVVVCGIATGLCLGMSGYAPWTWRFWIIALPINLIVVLLSQLFK